MFWMYTLSGIQLINIFCYTSEFETVSILISSYLLEVALEFTLNAMLFTDDVISKRYENGGSVDMMTTLMLSFCSNMISNVLATLISKLTNFNIVLESIKLEVKDQNEFYSMNMKLYNGVIRIRLILFFVVEFVLLTFCLYYVTIFCKIYSGSQSIWLFDCITGIGISLAISIAISFVVALLRYISLKCKAKRFFIYSKFMKRYQ